ncbi:AbrB/MazE/SpoVT family DNA-binding domain-containing protein [Thermodesulfobium sp. 4217-1]|uniref:AbrB/MazE/SpoVT family DNA-binding domain-containing protein n=1 Tax=Thermodesulfobium sp. 4217-1 TaxID=3120013 RepID=UPI0032214F7E
MRAKVKKWGNSLVIRIPKPLASEMQLNNKSLVEISKIKNEIVIKPISKSD